MTVEEIDDLVLSRIDGLYVGMLDDGEMAVFNDACRRGVAKRDYAHVGGTFGLPKVKRVLTISEEIES